MFDIKIFKILLLLLSFFYFQNNYSQCFEIESILVDACGGQEGYNEMVRFKVGNSNLDTKNLSVNWPSNSWQGIVQNSTTEQVVANLNIDIQATGGCKKLIEPKNGIIPSNTTVIIVTSYNIDITQNPFGALTEDIYILFQDNGNVTGGHFGNFGNGIRTLNITFGGSCSDFVSYDRSQLTDINGNRGAGDGATVNFTPSGTASYSNYNCSAPVNPFIVDAGIDITTCENKIKLNGNALGYSSIKWQSTNGTFSNDSDLNSEFTIDPIDFGKQIDLTLTAVNGCGVEKSDKITLTVNNIITPDFITNTTFCKGATAPVLNTTSPNGIVGSWSPTVIDNTKNGVYMFTPNSGQCASTVSMDVTVTNSITPNFITNTSFCKGATAPVLNTISPNGVVGSWSPTVIDNTKDGVYIFTPNNGQCASIVSLNVTVTNSITPDFITNTTFCEDATAPVLNTTSPNGIVGSWLPAVIDNTKNGLYTFTPNIGQCASTVSMDVTVTNSITPNFITNTSFCKGATAPVLNTISPNGVVGSWSPTVIDNTKDGVYVFTPNSGQCASSVSLNVTVKETTNAVTTFSYKTPICSNEIQLSPILDKNFTKGGTFSSDNNLNINSTTGIINISLSNIGNHKIVYTIPSNNNLCLLSSSSFFEIQIKNMTNLNPISGPNQVCNNNKVSLTNDISGGTWQSSNNKIATIDNNGLLNPISVGNVNIKYSLGNDACSNSVSKNININDNPVLTIDNRFLCIDNKTGNIYNPIVIDTRLSNNNYTFNWSHENIVLASHNNTLLVNQIGNYKIEVIDKNTGCNSVTNFTVNTSSKAIATAIVAEDFENNQSITINVSGGSGNYIFQLDNDSPQYSNVFNNITEGEHKITIIDTNGCGNIILTVYSINYPRFFTPNSDGINDHWNISGLKNQSQAKIYIFDRYGKLLRAFKPSQSIGWDGNYNNNMMPASDYWFLLEYKNSNQEDRVFKAHFSLKR